MSRSRSLPRPLSRLGAGLVLAALALVAVTPGTASAATPFTAGTGEQPSVAVGPDGTGHVVWETGDADARVGYCRVSPGTSACNRAQLLDFGTVGNASSAGRAQVFVSPGNEVVVTANCHQCPSGDTTSKTFRWTSSDGGGSFGAAAPIGSGTEVNGFGALLFDLGQTFVGTNGSRVKAAAFGGDGVQYATGGLFSFSPDVARVPLLGTVRLVAAVNDLSTIKYGVYQSAGPHSAASIDNPANWETDKTLEAAEPENSETALNSGPNGVFLTYLSEVPGDPHVGVRRFDSIANVFRLPIYVEGSDPIDASIQEPDSFQDPAGRIHVVWDSRHDGGRLRYVVSDTGAGGFGAAANLAAGERFAQPQVAAGADGRGFVVWTGAAGDVRVVPLDPQPEPSGSSGGSPGTGGAAGTGGSTGSSPGAGTPSPDARRPAVKGATIGSRTLRPGEGTEFRFRSSEAGEAVLTIEKRFAGLKVRGKAKRGGAARTRCLPRTAKRLRALRRQAGTPQAYRRLLRKRSCRGWRRIGQIRQRVRSGLNTIPFDGRVAGRRLGRGSYRATLVVTNAAGNASRTETLRFQVVVRAKPANKR